MELPPLPPAATPTLPDLAPGVIESSIAPTPATLPGALSPVAPYVPAGSAAP
jgi:hypothetical protein